MRHVAIALLFFAIGCGPEPAVNTDADGGRTSDAGGDNADMPVDSSDFSQPDAGSPTSDVGGPSGDTGTDVGEGAHDAGPVDAGMSSGLFVPATSGSYSVPFTIDIAGNANAPLGAISVSGGSGTVELNGTPAPVGVYQRQEWTEFGYTLYQGIAVDDDRWWVVWFYCQGDTLSNVYYQGTAGPTLATVPASGSCSDAASNVTVDFPATDLRVEPLLDRFTVTGQNIDIRPNVIGSLTDAGSTFDVHAFGHVDCTVECGADGWHEIHAVLRDVATDEVCFAIFYLYEDMR